MLNFWSLSSPNKIFLNFAYFFQEYQEAKAELKTMYNHVTEGIIIKSRRDWYELGEKSSRYLLGLEKRNKTETHLRKLATG